MFGRYIRQLAADVHAILLLLEKQRDVASLKITIDPPTKQEGRTQMVAKLGTSVAQPMLDDQKTTMHVAPLDANGNPSAFASGTTGPTNPAYTVDNAALVTLTPAADGLSCAVVGVKKSAGGTATVTATYTNPDATTATGTAVFTITIDPAELDVASLGVTVDPPVAQ